MAEKIKERIALKNPISDTRKVTYKGEDFRNWTIENPNYVGFFSLIVHFDNDIWLTRELKYNKSKYSIGKPLGSRKDGSEYDLWDIYDYVFCKNTIEKEFIESDIFFTEKMDDGQSFSGIIHIYDIKELHNKHYHGVVVLD